MSVAGGFLALWQFRSSSGEAYEIRGQLFDLDQNRIGDEFSVSGPLTGSPGLVGAALLDNGNVVVSWTDRSVANDTQLTGVVLTPWGAGSPFPLNTATAGNQLVPTIAALQGGGFAAVWHNVDAEGGSASSAGNIKLQLFDDWGAKVGGEVMVNSITERSQLQPAIARLAGGGFVVVWADRSEGVPELTVLDWVIKAQIFDAAGNKSGGEFRVNSVTDGDQEQPQVAGLASGGFVVTWISSAPPQSPAGTYDIRAQIFDAAGIRAGGEITANTTTPGQQLSPRIQALRDGGFVIAWEDQSPSSAGGDTSFSAVRAQMFDAAGATMGAELLVNTFTDGSQFGASIALLDSGDLAIGWTGPIPWNWTTGVHYQLMSQVATGGAGADTIDVGTGDATDAAGLAGNDTLIGSDYRNLLDGGSGDDSMSGGLGDDIYIVDSVGDLVAELADEGFDTIRTTLSSYTLAAGNVEALVGISAIGQTLTGSSADDQILGGAGNDVLHGGAGEDQLMGGAGDDRIVGTGDDRMEGGLGDDVFVVGSEGDSIYEAYGEGYDRIETTAASYRLVYSVEVLVGLLDTGQTLTGNFDADRIIGGGGNDVIDGGSGADTLEGGLGDDIYLIGYQDVIVEAAGGGVDEVRTRESFTLPANVENLTLTYDSYFASLIGNDLANLITGNRGPDILDGGGGADTLVGGDGNDRLTGGAGADDLYGGAGADYFLYTAASDSTVPATDRIRAFESNVDKLDFSALGRAWATWSGATDPATGAAYTLVTVTSTGGTLSVRVDGTVIQWDIIDDVIRGDGGNNFLGGRGGQDIILGLGGNDRLVGMEDDDELRGGDGDDELIGDSGSDILRGGAGNDVYWYVTSDDSVFEAAGEGNDEIVLNGGVFSLVGLGEIERLRSLGAATVTGNEFNNAISGGDSNFADTLDGAGGDDELRGNSGNDILIGGSGNDLLDGGTGADEMRGGTGDDIYIVDDVNDLIVEEEGGGNDLVRSLLSVYTLAATFRTLEGGSNYYGQTLNGNGLANTITSGGDGSRLNGLSGDDTLTGVGGSDTLDGGEGNDRMFGAGGDDVVVISAGIDIADGGEGIDAISGSFGGSAVGVTLDLRQATNSGALGTYSNFEKFGEITGSNHDDFFATSWMAAETLHLGAGNDTAVVTGGGDIVHGGAGIDTLVFDRTGGTDYNHMAGPPTANPGGGYDGFYNDYFGRKTISYTSIERFVISVANFGSFVVTGDGDDRLNGGSGFDQFQSGAGADILSGGGGNDLLDGGLGADSMTGGDGDDVFIVDDAGDAVIESAGAGTDEVRTSLASYALTDNVETLTGTWAGGQSLSGNRLANTITGAAGKDILMGSNSADWNNGISGGVDTLIGGLGGDLYYVDDFDTVIEQANSGNDEVRTRGNYTLTANVETLRGVSDLGQILQGNELGNAIFGKDGADTLRGMAGNDTLTGGAGNDVMEGGTGDDIYVVEGADTVTELAGEGTDEVRTALGSRTNFAAMYILPTNVENLTGISATGQGVYGNALNNVVAMGAGSDLVVLDGGGNDLVSGGGGDDFLYWGAAFTSADKADGGAGFDTVGLLGSYALTFDADDFVSIEKLAVYSSGNAAAPNGYSLTMHDGNVAAGQKMMVVAQSLAAGEAFSFNGAAEADGSFNVRGGRGGDTITGGAKADTIWGGLGADTLRGGAGGDVFEYGSTAESKGAGADVIMDFAKGDKINLTPIDADGNAANGDTKFTWLGAGAFTGHAGELRVSQHPQYGTTWVVEADTNGDKLADLTIYLVAPAGFLPEKSDFYV
ncbi:MAG TPA: hypothetical protein VF680_16705 [Allosphingosinicella sp.]